MDDPYWEPLPTLWPQPAVCSTIDKLLLLVFTHEGVPTWEVRIDPRKDVARRDELLVTGTGDSFEAARTAALFKAIAIGAS